MEQKSVHRLIYKLESKVLKRAGWNLTLPVKTALKSCPEVIVSLNDSQCLRFIDEINGAGDINEKVRSIQKKIRFIKKQPRSRENRLLINSFYDAMYSLQFQKDYICVIMNTMSDYDRANQGFSVNYGMVDGKECCVHYRRLLGTNGGIKNSTIVYVNEDIYPELKRRLDNGRDMSTELVPAKLEAYQALICSGSVPIPEPNGIIVVKDCITTFKEDVILINDEQDGEPKLTHEHGYEIEHNDSDGYGLMLPSYSRRVNEYLTGDGEHTLSGMNTRYAWTKGMLYTFDFLEFADRVAGTYEVTDVWGSKRDIRDAEVVLTESMLKLWSSYSSWEDYYENCQKNHYQFSATKTTPDQLENVRDTNYQFLQSYEFSDDELQALCQPTIDEIRDVISLDPRKSLTFLAGFNLNEKNAFNDNLDCYIRALMVDESIINDPFVRKKIYNMIRKRIEMGSRGAVRINANFAMISGDPYALAESIFGMEVKGLLKPGEVYHRYWIDKGAEEIACFRAPMTCHNNIRRMKLNNGDNTKYWYQYITSALIYNARDSSCEAMNGADKDGDTSMCTDNPILVRNTLNSPTIVCLQKKAEKKIVTEEDIIVANKLAFNDDIGTVTNRVTSMFELLPGYDSESEEYKTLKYRIMCGQLFQQNTIDRAKGVIAKPMPEYWHSIKPNIVRENDDDETKRKKDFNYRITAAKKPYFMIYIYPRLKSEYNKYTHNNNSGAIRRFHKYGINGLADLERYEPKTKAMSDYLMYYNRLLPVGIGPCVVNRMSWIFEGVFKKYLSRLNKLQKESSTAFDYRVLKGGVVYSRKNYEDIRALYQEYSRRVSEYQRKIRTEKVDKESESIERDNLIEYFKSECYRICSNENELCDIVLDLCYRREGSKQFAWDICGDVILNNLLSRNGYTIHYPELVEENGDFTYCGKQFAMREKKVGEMIDNPQ